MKKESLERIIDSFIADKNAKYGLNGGGHRGNSFRIEKCEYQIDESPRALLKAYCKVVEHDLDHPDFKDFDYDIYVFKSEQDAERYVRRYSGFGELAMWTHFDSDEDFADDMERYGVLPYDEALRLFRRRAWKKITDAVLKNEGAERFLSLDIPPYKYEGYVFYTFAFEEDWDYGFYYKVPRTDE